MRALLTALLLAMSIANPLSAEVKCSDKGNLAKQIMASRQFKKPISEVIADLHERLESFSDPKVIKWAIKTAIHAYEQPVYEDIKDKDSALKKFRNMIELQCFKELYE